MENRESQTVVGFAVFDKFEECYEYNEDACMIASSKEAARVIMQQGFSDPNNCRIDAVTFRDIMSDFGGSGGEYAIERQAYETFERLAKLNDVTFTSELYDGMERLLVVQVDGVDFDDD